MKLAKYLGSLMMVLALSMYGTGCDSDDDGGGGSLVGTWRLVSSTENGVQQDTSQDTVTFDEGGTYTYTWIDDYGPGTQTGMWDTEDGQLVITDEDGGDETSMSYDLDGDTLTITQTEEFDGQTYVWVSTYDRI